MVATHALRHVAAAAPSWSHVLFGEGVFLF